MGSDTEILKAERGAGILIYRLIIMLGLALASGLGAWNLSETHASAVLLRGLSEHVRDRDQEMSRIASSVLELTKAVESLKDQHAKDRDEGMNRDAKLETRVSVLEEEIKKP